IRDLKGNDLLIGSRGTDLHSITLQDSNSPNPICLMPKATSSQAWLWHQFKLVLTPHLHVRQWRQLTTVLTPHLHVRQWRQLTTVLVLDENVKKMFLMEIRQVVSKSSAVSAVDAPMNVNNSQHH
nr:integrase, catalytic region, zinc finger, CCHC-type, peptidase aspartic, catalytic [Tanacetum cinerariifolium]